MYLLDTNVCIALINGSPAKARDNFQRAVEAGEDIFVSSISSFELWYGVKKSDRREFNQRRLETFLAGPLQLLPFDLQNGMSAGFIRYDLEVQGKQIGTFDTLLAGQALRHDLILATANVREFSRVKGLNLQNWVR